MRQLGRQLVAGHRFVKSAERVGNRVRDSGHVFEYSWFEGSFTINERDLTRDEAGAPDLHPSPHRKCAHVVALDVDSALPGCPYTFPHPQSDKDSQAFPDLLPFAVSDAALVDLLVSTRQS